MKRRGLGPERLSEPAATTTRSLRSSLDRRSTKTAHPTD
ncbi:type I polyketide synthase domain protein [Mycobacterium ulcerans str. Harvey]|uniref:Type I polyketide synthase domain protein n=1 Tax=Mycobacterium ulcerans str. Harvey TaxID=1299332 RepID=A0ABP3A125_MYCUL|nr:type I polyketide synthase domain protein [Mycobacterium ulcerans str. Harvey]